MNKHGENKTNTTTSLNINESLVSNEVLYNALYSGRNHNCCETFIYELYTLGVSKGRSINLWNAGFRSVLGISRASDNYLIESVKGIGKATVSKLREKLPYITEEEYIDNMPCNVKAAKAAKEAASKPEPQPELTPMFNLFLPVAAHKALVEHGYKHVEDILHMDMLDIFAEVDLTAEHRLALSRSLREFKDNVTKNKYYSTKVLDIQVSGLQRWFATLNRSDRTVHSYRRFVEQVKRVASYILDIMSYGDLTLNTMLPDFMLYCNREAIEELSDLLTTCESVEELRSKLEPWLIAAQESLDAVNEFCEVFCTKH